MGGSVVVGGEVVVGGSVVVGAAVVVGGGGFVVGGGFGGFVVGGGFVVVVVTRCSASVVDGAVVVGGEVVAVGPPTGAVVVVGDVATGVAVRRAEGGRDPVRTGVTTGAVDGATALGCVDAAIAFDVELAGDVACTAGVVAAVPGAEVGGSASETFVTGAAVPRTSVVAVVGAESPATLEGAAPATSRSPSWNNVTKVHSSAGVAAIAIACHGRIRLLFAAVADSGTSGYYPVHPLD